MSELEKMFTINDIAEMTSLSDRTIRNYLRNQLLIGRKVGGQWRFTMQDIKDFLNRSDIRASISEQRQADVKDFIDGINPATEGDRQACITVDLYISKEVATTYNEQICTYFNSNCDPSENVRISFDYSEKECRARFLLFSSPKIGAQVLEILK